MRIVAEGINDAWLQVMKGLQEGATASPRGFKIKERLNTQVVIKNPRKRILWLPVRKASLPFGFGEFIWYITGRNDVAMMEYYSSRMKNFSDDGETLNSAYGYRIFGKHPQLPFNQWDNVVDILKRDPDSRQAVIHLHTPNNKPTKDEVCTLSLQFFIREGKLDMTTNMRSNDIVWGFTYDVFSFTLLQELMANELGVEVGTYTHNAGSMHIYERDFEMLMTVMDVYDELMYATQYDKEFRFDGVTLNSHELGVLCEVEGIYRDAFQSSNSKVIIKHHDLLFRSDSIKVMNDILYLYFVSKKCGKESVVKSLEYDNLYHSMMRNQLSGKSLEDSRQLILEGTDGAGKTTLLEKLGNLGKVQLIRFLKPYPELDKRIYFHTALLTGDVILDRAFYSDIVYARYFQRKVLVNHKDISCLEKLLNYRDAKLLILDTPPKVCHSRLDEEDTKVFNVEDIENLHKGYITIFRISNLKNNRKFLDSEPREFSIYNWILRKD